MSRSLTYKQFLAEAEPCLRKIFIGDDPFDKPIAPEVMGRMIIYYHKYTIEDYLSAAILKVAESFKDKGFYFTGLFCIMDDFFLPHWYFPMDELTSYCEEEENVTLPAVLENVIYSSDANWGIMLSHEGHGVFAGEKYFLDAVCSILPELNNEVYSFLAFWKKFISKIRRIFLGCPNC